MPDPIPAKTPELPSKEAAELAAYRAKEEREKRIQADMAWRRETSRGGIPDNMLREIAEAQIAHDDKEAKAVK